MDSCILRITVFLYLAIGKSNAFIIPAEEGGAMNENSPSKVSETNSLPFTSEDSNNSASQSMMSAPINEIQKQEDYWKEQLGNHSKMPKAVKDSLFNNGGQQTEVMNTPADIEEGVVQSSGRRTMKDKHHHRGHAHVSVGPNDGVVVRARKHGGGHANVDVAKSKGVSVNAGKNGKGADVQVNKGGVTVNAGSKERPVYVGVKPGVNPFQYDYTKSQKFHDRSTRALFFLEKDMKPGHSIMNLHLTKKFNAATFLPREKADSLPFSSDKLEPILREFSIEPRSEEAQVIEETIKGCEHRGIRGEQKYCATSLESLVDYAKKTLGNNTRAMSTEAEGIVDNVQNYTIAAIKKVAKDNEAVVCHKQNYAYAVFYCHKSKATSAFMISLLHRNGSKAKSMAVCHRDTSAWNPQHLAFEVLNVKPGSVPVCHFLPEDHLVWVPY